jgi:3'-phosphoadenosine 5'-phosphosulfate sulfotransferase (PAPS reductase)/FAD synthetase
MSALWPTDRILSFLKEKQPVSLGFSLGKDSAVCLDLMLRSKIEVYPIYFYTVPDLEFVEKGIRKFEDHYKIKIIQLPHPMLYDAVRKGDFLPPHHVKGLQSLELPKVGFEDIAQIYFEHEGINVEWDVAGMKQSDSFNRRMVIRKYGCINEEARKVYLVYNFRDREIWKYMLNNRVPIIDDYKLFGRSFDGLNYQYLVPIKKHYPDDYKRIIEMFPLAEMEILRYEYSQRRDYA